jgi:hypothetical protein
MTEYVWWNTGMMDLFSYVKYHNEMRAHLRYGFSRVRNYWKRLLSC